MGLLTKIFKKFATSDLSTLLRYKVTDRIIRALERREVPWQKPWEGVGNGVGFPREIKTKKKFFGVNFLLLQMSAREHGFISSWWGNIDAKERPDDVPPGCWATETVCYQEEANAISSIVYNYDQSSVILESKPQFRLMPSFALAEKVLHSTKAKIVENNNGVALYYYPPHDFITIPDRAKFEAGLGGLPGYYESLAHELLHWTECRLGFDINCDEEIRELRADIGAAMLMEELGVPHSISFSNYEKWRLKWIELLKNDPNIIFRVCASACKATDYIMKSSVKPEPWFNPIEEILA